MMDSQGASGSSCPACGQCLDQIMHLQSLVMTYADALDSNASLLEHLVGVSGPVRDLADMALDEAKRIRTERLDQLARETPLPPPSDDH